MYVCMYVCMSGTHNFLLTVSLVRSAHSSSLPGQRTDSLSLAAAKTASAHSRQMRWPHGAWHGCCSVILHWTHLYLASRPPTNSTDDVRTRRSRSVFTARLVGSMLARTPITALIKKHVLIFASSRCVHRRPATNLPDNVYHLPQLG